MQQYFAPSRTVRSGIFAAIGSLVIAVVALSHTPSYSTVAAFKIVLTLAAVLASVVTTRTGLMARGQARVAWLALAVALAVYALAVGMRAWDAILGREREFPFWADLLRLCLPLTGTALVLLLPLGLTRVSRLRLLLDGLVVTGSFIIVVWIGALEQVYQSRPADRALLATSIAYPMVDTVWVTAALLVFMRAPAGQRLMTGLIAVTGLCFALTNNLAVYYISAQQYSGHRVVAAGWLAGLLLFVAVAIAGRTCAYRHTAVVQPPSPASVLLPFVPVAAAIVATFAREPKQMLSTPAAVAGALLTVAFLARQLIVVGENGRLFAAVTNQALRDPLTGLANRAVFHDRVSHAMQMRERDGGAVAVLSLDIDDFKMVNDTFGYHIGDQLLRLVGERILAAVHSGYTVARVGGDEFAALIEGRDDHSQVVAQQIAEALDQPFPINGQELIIRASTGLAIADPDDGDITTAELLQRSDIALAAAKASRIPGVHAFAPEMMAEFFVGGVQSSPPAGGGHNSAVRLLGELRQAIDDDQLTLHYQPQLDLRSLEIVGVEALIRWPHPSRGMLGPDEFLPLVRRHGLMATVTDQVINRALDDALIWHQLGFDVPVAVNVAAPSLATPKLAATVERALAARGLSASSLIVEITEDLFLEGLERTTWVLRVLRDTGVRIAVDDFGSGYSALSYLRDLPLDHVKLDRRFVAPVIADPRAAAVVRAVIDLAHELGLSTVAEGIEDFRTLSRLRELGCDVGQGYYFSAPVERDVLLAMFASPPWAPVSTKSS
ncbi:bifunctional diguanylate cyclase/phosphodiesterase [Mycobacterium sp. NBC_00419]|uniref:putative bifunctional diguanylate cyclase/phosphodiesterase n=1 Tax=Mycobacterium sp. NBC_00419 TaxID=2975989 RepID=UPI002E249F38